MSVRPDKAKAEAYSTIQTDAAATAKGHLPIASAAPMQSPEPTANGANGSRSSVSESG